MYFRVLKDGGLVDRSGEPLAGIFVNRRPDCSVFSWTVRWREPTGKRGADGKLRYTNRSRSKKTPEEAVTLWETVRELREDGQVPSPAPPASKKTLDELAVDWSDELAVNVTPKHLGEMARLWDKHVHPFIGHRTIAEVVEDNGIFSQFQRDMTKGNAKQGLPALTDPSSQRKTLYMVRGVMARARLKYPKAVPTDPTAGMFVMPTSRPERRARPLPAEAVERIREAMLGRRARVELYPLRDAALVSALSGIIAPRPSELLAVTWDDIGETTVQLRNSAAGGTVTPGTKTFGRASRLLKPIAEDLFRWRVAIEELYGPQPGGGLVFQWLDPKIGPLWNRDGTPMPWPKHEWSRWGQRVWRPATKVAARSDRSLLWLTKAVPYDLRHTAVSLGIRSDAGALLRGEPDGTRVDSGTIAHWAGHTEQELSRTYQHVFDEYSTLGVLDPAQLITDARELVAAEPFELDKPLPSSQAEYLKRRRARVGDAGARQNQS